MKVKILNEETMRMAELFGWKSTWYVEYGIAPILYNIEYTVFSVYNEKRFFLLSLRDGLQHENIDQQQYWDMVIENNTSNEN